MDMPWRYMVILLCKGMTRDTEWNRYAGFYKKWADKKYWTYRFDFFRKKKWFATLAWSSHHQVLRIQSCCQRRYGQMDWSFRWSYCLQCNENRDCFGSGHYRGKRAVLGSYMDITESKVMEQSLLKSKEKYRSMSVSTSPVMIFLGSVMPYRPMAANVNMMPSSVPNWPT